MPPDDTTAAPTVSDVEKFPACYPSARELLAEIVLTADEAGRLLKVSADTIKNLDRTGQLQSHKCGRRNVWRRADVVAYVESWGAAR